MTTYNKSKYEKLLAVQTQKVREKFCKGFGCQSEVAEMLMEKSFIGKFNSKEAFVLAWLEKQHQLWRADDKDILNQIVEELFNSFYVFVEGYVFYDRWSH